MRVARVICTHNGKGHTDFFHADEVFACMMLKLLPRFERHVIVRTRDEEVVKTADVVVDIGMQYNSSLLRFDHHQPDFHHTFESRPTLLSSAGLIYRHFGHQLLPILSPSLLPDDLSFLFKRTYCALIESVDGTDNGVPRCSGEVNFRDYTSISTEINRMNVKSLRFEDEVFEEAMDLARNTLTKVVGYIRDNELPAKKLVESAFENRKQYHKSGGILVLQRSCPWKVGVEELNWRRVQVMYVVSPSQGKWEVVRTVQERGGDSVQNYDNCRRLPGVLSLRRDLASGVTTTEDTAINLASTLLDLRRLRSR